MSVPDTDDGARAYLLSIACMTARKQANKLMGKIASNSQYGRAIPESWWDYLHALTEPKRFKKFRARIARKKPRKSPKASPMPRLKVTRSVKYTYRESDNKGLAAFYSSSEWKAMRYEALRLHGAQCQCCGASPGSGVVLNVDHIKPLRAFWALRLDLNNLQVLCGDCNQGKGARHDDDWRTKRDMAMFDMDRPDRI